MPCAGREGVVVVMPPLPETEKTHQGVVAALVTGLVVTASPEVTDAIHAPGDMVNHEDTDQTSPDESEHRPGPGPRDHTCDRRRNQQTEHHPERKEPVDGRDPRIGKQIGSVACLVGLVELIVKGPSHMGVKQSLRRAEETVIPAGMR